jgi:hypothetical protein
LLNEGLYEVGGFAGSGFLKNSAIGKAVKNFAFFTKSPIGHVRTRRRRVTRE